MAITEGSIEFSKKSTGQFVSQIKNESEIGF
jgi:hypothetical protein